MHRRPAPARTSLLALTLALTLALASLLASLTATAGPATAAEETPAEETAADAPARGLQLEAGWSGKYQPGEAIPVRVLVTADRLLSGRLEVAVTDDGFGTAPNVVVPVEVPGGSTKEYFVVVPSSAQQAGGNVRAVLVDDGTTVAQGEIRLEASRDTELVGLLPGVLDGRPLPGTAPLAVDAGTAQFSAVDPATLTTPGALSSLDVLGVAPGELATLDQGSRDAVLAWVASGGNLLTDDAAGTEVAGLPPTWQPGEDGRGRGGLGEVRTAGGAMAAGAFAGLVEPTSPSRSGSDLWASGEPVDVVLARDAGLRVAQLGWLVGFLATYVLVAVPLTLTVLRRLGRGELGWVVLPVVALAFTGGGYLAGRDLRDDATTAHATVLALSDAGAVATTSVGVVSGAGGTVGTTFPDSWVPATQANQGWWGPSPPVAAERTGDGLQLSQDLPPGAFGVRTATGPVSVEGEIEVTAAAEGDQVRGTVRNTLGHDLEDVAVFQGGQAVLVGDIASGTEADFELPVGVSNDPFNSPAREVWRDATGFDRPPDPDSVVALPLWESFESRVPTGSRAAGLVSVAGWTRGFEPPVEDVAGELSGTTLVVAPASVATGEPQLPQRLRATRVRSGASFDGAFPGESFVWRYTAPGPDVAVGASSLVVVAPEAGFDLDVWRDGAWQPVALGDAAPPPEGRAVGPLGPMAEVPLPDGSSTGGAVWLRGTSTGIDPFTLLAIDAVTVEQVP